MLYTIIQDNGQVKKVDDIDLCLQFDDLISDKLQEGIHILVQISLRIPDTLAEQTYRCMKALSDGGAMDKNIVFCGEKFEESFVIDRDIEKMLLQFQWIAYRAQDKLAYLTSLGTWVIQHWEENVDSEYHFDEKRKNGQE